MARKTVAELQGEWWAQNPKKGAYTLSPEEAGEFMVTSAKVADQCLTHLVRWVHVFPALSHFTPKGRVWTNAERHSYQLQCGNMLTTAKVVSPSEETFVCARCLAAAERYGEPTFNMIPTTGCEASGGRRRGRPKSKV